MAPSVAPLGPWGPGAPSPSPKRENENLGERAAWCSGVIVRTPYSVVLLICYHSVVVTSCYAVLLYCSLVEFVEARRHGNCSTLQGGSLRHSLGAWRSASLLGRRASGTLGDTTRPMGPRSTQPQPQPQAPGPKCTTLNSSTPVGIEHVWECR